MSKFLPIVLPPSAFQHFISSYLVMFLYLLTAKSYVLCNVMFYKLRYWYRRYLIISVPVYDLNTCYTWYWYQLVCQHLVHVLKYMPGYQILPMDTCHNDKILLFCCIPELFCRSPWRILMLVLSILFMSLVFICYFLETMTIQAIRLHQDKFYVKIS